MSPHESTAIANLATAVSGLTQELTAMRQELAVLNTKLFGEQDKETEQGRLPRIEARQKDHERRLKRVEPLARVMRALYAVGLALVGYLINHFLPFKGH